MTKSFHIHGQPFGKGREASSASNSFFASRNDSIAAPLGSTARLRSLQYYRPVARELKRLEPLARSPVYAEQSAAASGVTTIRQLGLGNVMAVL